MNKGDGDARDVSCFVAGVVFCEMVTATLLPKEVAAVSARWSFVPLRSVIVRAPVVYE